MAEIRLQIDDQFLNDLRAKLGQNIKPVDMVRESLTLLEWAAEQRRAGNFVLAGTEDGTALYRLSQQVLNRVPQDTAEVRAAKATAG